MARKVLWVSVAAITGCGWPTQHMGKSWEKAEVDSIPVRDLSRRQKLKQLWQPVA